MCVNVTKFAGSGLMLLFRIHVLSLCLVTSKIRLRTYDFGANCVGLDKDKGKGFPNNL
jgi:hypothetical protein